MNPLKCTFGVTSEKFLGFIVRHRGIEIDQAKVDAILKMPELRNIHELKRLQGKLAYLKRFISNLAGKCQPFSRLMKKGVPFVWNQACSNASQSIKSYLMKPPVLAAPIPGKPLIPYIAAQERMMTPNKLKFEKLCLALVFAIQKLKHYFQAHDIRLVSKANPIKFVMSKPILNDRLTRWYLQFQQFEIVYIQQKVVKGQALEDFLVDHPILDDWELTDELPDEDAMVIEVQPPWKMYFDGAAHREGASACVVFVNSQGEVLTYSFTLTLHCSNNIAEYQALILGLEIAVDMRQLQLHIFGDSGCRWTTFKIFWKTYIHLGCTDYFSKWAEAVALKEVKKENIAKFIRVNIIYRFGIPIYIITDNGKSFDNKLMRKICDLFGFKQRNLSMYYTAANRLAEAFNKTLCILPLERQIPSLRLAVQERLIEEENARLRLEGLESLDEKRLEAQ
ncbi:uncharacterized protein [Nicotiana tomentosiformis]|uniref:uncharacterized protein n=1 Tax=Nicotiana tomentosiformis TaxID=4098 RepID=UPI00388C8BEE